MRLATSNSNPAQKFAIKSIEKSKLKKDFYLLKRELQTLRRLDHPNVIKFYETYQDDRYFYLVMEYCSGGELLDKIAKQGKLNEDEVANIMQKAFSAVKYLHTLGVVHRDLKPENFMFSSNDSDSEAKIIDFGLSKYMGDSPNYKLSTAVGTALYMAPEILTGSYDERCDNWSLGVIMYVLLSGCPPFEGNNSNAVLQKVVQGKYTLNTPEWKKISSEAKNLIQGLLVVDPRQRFTASEALNHEWFKAKLGQKTTISILDDKMLKSLKSFRPEKEENLLKFEAKKVMVNLLQESEIKTLRDTFRYLDKKNTGLVSIDELKKVLKDKNSGDNDRVLDNLTPRPSNTGSSGLINYTTFLINIIDDSVLYTEERVWAAFKHFDLGNKDEITIENIKVAMARSGRRVNEDEVKGMISSLNLKRPGRVTIDEFKMLLDVKEESPKGM